MRQAVALPTGAQVMISEMDRFSPAIFMWINLEEAIGDLPPCPALELSTASSAGRTGRPYGEELIGVPASPWLGAWKYPKSRHNEHLAERVRDTSFANCR
jgi:hypothetical protein